MSHLLPVEQRVGEDFPSDVSSFSSYGPIRVNNVRKRDLRDEHGTSDNNEIQKALQDEALKDR